MDDSTGGTEVSKAKDPARASTLQLDQYLIMKHLNFLLLFFCFLPSIPSSPTSLTPPSFPSHLLLFSFPPSPPSLLLLSLIKISKALRSFRWVLGASHCTSSSFLIFWYVERERERERRERREEEARRRGGVEWVGNTLLMVLSSFAGEEHTYIQVIETGGTNHQHMTLRMGE